MEDPADVRLANLARFVFSAPSWRRSMIIAVILGFAVDLGLTQYDSPARFFGTLAFTLPTLAAFAFTRPMVVILDRPLTWNRSALLAAASMIFMVLITMPAVLLARDLVPLVYATAIGFAFGLRLLVLVAVSDYRVLHMVAPASVQPVAGVVVGTLLFGSSFAPLSVLLMGVFLLGFSVLIWLIERPLDRAFGIRGLSFLNAFIAHLTDGSRAMEEFFREIGESVTVPQTSFFFRREGRPTTEAILACRLIDRPLRPAFVKGLRNEVQIVETILAIHPDDAYDVVAINAASMSTQLSGLPFSGPIGGVRIALIDGQWVAFPRYSEVARAVFSPRHARQA